MILLSAPEVLQSRIMGVDILNLVTEWPSLSCENIIQPTQNVS